MAAAHSSAAVAALRYRRLSTATLFSRKSNLLISCVFASLPSKPTRRKNYLRQKILKTLKRSDIAIPKPELIPIDSPPLEEANVSCTVQEILESESFGNPEAGNEVEKSGELGELKVEVSAPAGDSVDKSITVLGKNSFMKFGMWLIGAFVFHTVCAIWVFGPSVIGDKNGDMAGNGASSVTEVGGGNEKNKSRAGIVLQGNGNGRIGVGNGATDSIVYVNELEMERKIEEIQVMAREARKKERLKSKKNGYDGQEESDEEKHSKSAIEEEVEDRLIKLRKKLESLSKNMPVASVRHSGKNDRRKGDIVGEPEEGGGNGALLFQKKYKFKGLPFDVMEKPKGFTGLNDYKVDKESGGMVKGDNGAIDLVDGEKPAEVSDVDSKGSDGVHIVEEDKAKDMSDVKEPTKNESKSAVKEATKKERRSAVKEPTKNARRTVVQEPTKKARRTAVKEQGMSKQGEGKGASNPKVVDGQASENNNGRLTLGAVKSRKTNAITLNSRKSNDLGITVGNGGPKGKGDTKHWWLNLPYVLVIVMRRGDNGEGGEGFYTLKCISSSEDDLISHMVAFEDQVDANNFCYLLQSFFNEMEDFRADVIPLTAKELNEVVISRTMKAIVVKRGQLRLYAGQPLAEAEMALQSLVET